MREILQHIMEQDVFKLASSEEMFDDQGICEGIAQAHQQFPAIPKETLNQLADFDPTQNKKYVVWMAKVFTKSPAILYSPSTFNTLKEFDELCQRNIIKNKDIGSYQTLEQVAAEVQRSLGTITTSQQKKGVKNVGTIPEEDIVFQNDKVVVVEPKTKEASILYGRGSHWCTAAMGENNMFDRYTQNGRLFYILPVSGAGKLTAEYSKLAVWIQKGYISLYDQDDVSMNNLTDIIQILTELDIDFMAAFGVDLARLKAKFDGWYIRYPDGTTAEVDIYRPQTREQAQKYGAGTQWSISNTNNTEYNQFLRYYQLEGNTFFVIVPKDGSGKILMQIPPATSKGSGTHFYFYDKDGREITVKLFR